MSPRLLLLSNSTQSGTKYLEIWKAAITSFLKESKVTNITFIPFAGVTIDWDSYTKKVRDQLTDFTVKGIHEYDNMTKAIADAEAIVIGGGNTFHLLFTLQKEGLIDPIRSKVLSGTPYVGWSAGSNVATPDIGTTNDMPVIWPTTDKALDLVPFNINPHYNEWKPPNYQGEGRGDRLNEAVTVRKRIIVALSEATCILVEEEPPRYTLLKAPTSLLPKGTQVQAKIWKPKGDSFEVVNVALGDGDEPVSLNKYLETHL